MTATLSSSKFTYSRANDMFTAELSELQNALGQDGGSFYIRSAKTGNTRLFLYEGMDTDGEDIAGWRYFSPANGHRALIIND